MAFLNIDSRSVAYRLLGDEANPLLVLAHPLGMTQAVWDDILAALLSRYRVLTWDLPGHGASQAFADQGAVTPEQLAAEVLALADHAGAPRFHFVGTSIGGVIGQALIERYAERLLSATLTNTGAVIGNSVLWNTRASRVREEGLAAMSGEIVPRWFAQAAFEASPALENGWRTAMGRGNDEAYALLCEMLGRSDFRGRLKAAAGIRVNLLAGSEDLATPPESLATLRDECAGAELTVFDAVGHVPSVEAPERFAAWLIEALAAGDGSVSPARA
ncbi:alpha/beta fold hydrolase [Onishia niordana]|uniref:alpha/beta fold hydrolase n=1 Tax=Onishia niordana TaxID=2508711 RepID=UPI00109F0170|nr:alpha/beta fold hydrolase [Halomonas niordiana]